MYCVLLDDLVLLDVVCIVRYIKYSLMMCVLLNELCSLYSDLKCSFQDEVGIDRLCTIR